MGINKIPLIYVAGPFAAATNYGVQRNVAAAEAAGLRIAQCGALPVVVHSMNRNYYGQLTETFWRAGVVELLRRCDAVFLIEGWAASTGAQAEKTEAERLGLKIFNAYAAFPYVELEKWVKGWPARREAEA